MDKYSIIAFKIVSILLKIKKGDVVSIAGEIHNLGNEPLSEISLIEELAIAIRKREGFPVLDISTEKLKNRYLLEIENKSFDFSYFSKYVDLIDTFVDIGWRSNPEIMNQLSDADYQEIVEHSNFIWSKIIESGKKILFMGYPTRELANYYQLNLNFLQESYFNGIDCDYSKLLSRSNFLQEQLSFNNAVSLNTNSENLICRYKKENIVLHNGQFNNSTTMILPTGRTEVMIDKIDGKFFAEKIYFKTKIFENIELEINNNVISEVNFSLQKTGNNELESILKTNIKKFILQIGINEELKEYSNYLLFDKNILGNSTIKLYTETDIEISFSNIHSEIKYMILDEQHPEEE